MSFLILILLSFVLLALVFLGIGIKLMFGRNRMIKISGCSSTEDNMQCFCSNHQNCLNKADEES